jgi:hypothetical protein
MRKVLVAAAALAALAGAARAEDAASADANRSDVRCMLAMTVIMRDDSYKQSATVGLYYFAGRLEARDAGLDLAQAMRREASRMQNREWQGEIQRCGAEVQAKTKAFEAVKAAFSGRGLGR